MDMETPEGKVSLLDAIPVRCDHILTDGREITL